MAIKLMAGRRLVKRCGDNRVMAGADISDFKKSGIRARRRFGNPRRSRPTTYLINASEWRYEVHLALRSTGILPPVNKRLSTSCARYE